jgi:hypothetical protein
MGSCVTDLVASGYATLGGVSITIDTETCPIGSGSEGCFETIKYATG